MKSLDSVVEDLDAAVNRKDLEAVLSYYEDDAVLVMEPGRIAQGIAEIRGFFKVVFDMNINARQLSTHVLQTEDVALFTSKWTAEGTLPNGEAFSTENVATSVFRKGEDSQWRMIIDNSFGPAVLDSNTHQ